MKKGDIVSLKQGKSLRGAELYESLSKGSNPQEYYTIKEIGYRRVGCGGEVELVTQFEETSKNDSFLAKFFDVVLLAGEPDIKGILKERKKELV